MMLGDMGLVGFGMTGERGRVYSSHSTVPVFHSAFDFFAVLM